MLILIYSFITNVFVPQIGAYAKALFEPLMITIIMVAGIVMIFGAVGMKISNNLGSTIIGGVFQAIGYVVKTLGQVVGWIIRNILRLIPSVFRESRRTFSDMGLNPIPSNILAVLVTTLIIIIII